MKTSMYMNIIEKDNYYILHNPLYGSMIKVIDSDLMRLVCDIKKREDVYDLTFDTSQEMEFYNDLINQKMIVENQTNEINILNYNFREWQLAASKKMGVIMLPTRNCNFRCPYCYEDHDSEFMTDDIYEGTLRWISENSKRCGCEQIGISWFGGEPMLAYDKIIPFMQKLREMNFGLRISGHMTTNGYLLTKDKFQSLIENSVTDFQITVDGMADMHDKTRYLVGGGGTWSVIINNLMDMKSLKDNFKITIRTNMSRDLVDSPEEWFEFLQTNFSDDKRFIFHCETIKDLGGKNKDFAYTQGEPREDPMQYILTLFKKYRLPLKNYTHYLNLFSMMCYAANPYNIVVDYDGSMEKCTICIDEERNKVGKIEKNSIKINKNNYAWWVDYDNKSECKNCKIYPICYGRKCPNSYYHPDACVKMRDLYEGTIRAAY